MALESGTYINSLNASNPVATDGLAQADDHLRLIKSTILSSFPGVTGAVTSTHAELNLLDGVTATTAEINYLDGVTSNVQTQIDGILTDVVEDTTPQLGGDLDTNGNKIQFGNWTIEVDSNNDLLFKYSNNTRIRMTSAGALDVEDDITAFSGI